MHPRDELKKLTKGDNVVFVKQVPLHPRDRLKKKTKKLKPIHPCDKKKRQVLQIAAENAGILLKGKIYDTSRINEVKIMDRILEALPANNDGLYVLHEPGTNTFTLKRENGK